MPDPIAGAIAGSVASTAIEKIVDHIDAADDPEKAWRRSVLEVAIQAEAFYRQEVVAGRLYSKDKIQRRMNDFGEIAQQLSIRGDIREYDSEFVELVRKLGNACGDFADAPGGIGQDPTAYWDETVAPVIEEVKERVEVD